MPHTRAVTLRRTLEWVAVAGLFAAILVALLGLLVDDVPSDTPVRPVMVEQGDTVWGLAQAYPVEGLTTADTAELIRRANGMASSVIHPGQRILVPDTEAGLRFAARD